eukprot:3204183-Amphidinium_carterae.1
MRAILSWAAEQDAEITEADVTNRFGTAAPAVEDVLAKAGQLYVALQQLTSKEAFDVLRNAPVGAGLEGWRRLVRRRGLCCALSSTLARPPASPHSAPPLRSGRSRSAHTSARKTRVV